MFLKFIDWFVPHHYLSRWVTPTSRKRLD